MRIYVPWMFGIGLLLVSAVAVRSMVIRPIVNYKLKDTARKKIKQGQTFKEWFLYTRFRKYIPPALIVWDFLNFVFSIVTAIICLVWLLVRGDNETLEVCNKIFLLISYAPASFIYLIVYGKGEHGVSNVVDRDKRYYKRKKKHPLQKKR